MIFCVRAAPDNSTVFVKTEEAKSNGDDHQVVSATVALVGAVWLAYYFIRHSPAW